MNTPMPSPPHHKQYTIAIRSANGHTTIHNISATLPQAVLWARAIGSGCLLPARITITTSTGNICWTETIAQP